MARRFGMTDFVNPDEVGRDKVVQAIVDLTGGGADFSFECIGNVHTMRQALECCHRGWGEMGHHRRRRLRPGDRDAAVPARHRPRLARHRLRRRRGRTDVPKIVDWYMEGKIEIDRLITHVMPLEEINTAFDLMHEGKSIRSVVEF